MKELSEQIEFLHHRVSTLSYFLQGPTIHLPTVLKQALVDLSLALEELQVTEEALESSHLLVEAERQRYQDLFNFVPVGYLVTNELGMVQEANWAAAGLLKLPQKSLIGKLLANFVVQEERQCFRTKLTELQQVNQSQEWEMLLQPKEGEPIDVLLTVSADSKVREQSLFYWLLHDLSDRKQAEAILLRAQAAELAKQALEAEIAQRQRAEAQLRRNAFHDPLTGLANRALFLDRLNHVNTYTQRQPDYRFAVLFLDLDGFKLINDSLGHPTGDQLLLRVAERLKSCLRPFDTIARLGGDEFTILVERVNAIADAETVAERVQAALELPFILVGQEVFVTTSIGISLSTEAYDQPEDLLRYADIAMYQAKAQGSGLYSLFNQGMHQQAVDRLSLKTQLRQAVEQEEFRIHYQPIVCLKTGKMIGFEALVRWQHPQQGLMTPGHFLPTAEKISLTPVIDRWVLEHACTQMHTWQQHFQDSSQGCVQGGALTLSVNLSSQQFASPNLIEQISQALLESQLNPERLILEITEGVIMTNAELAATKLSQLRSLGIRLAVDDFGTGYSSLGRLHHFPINVLKIDRSFVSRIGSEEGDSEIVETIVTLAHKLDLRVTAEGIETADQLAQLRQLNCEYGQGYFFSPPLDSEAAKALIRKNPQCGEPFLVRAADSSRV